MSYLTELHEYSDQEQARRPEAQLRVRVLFVLEMLAAYLDDTSSVEELRAFASDVYRFTHVANAPSCRERSPEWLADFERVERNVWESHAAPNGVPWEQQRDAKVRRILEGGE